jgi:hypothetical protein
MSRHLRTLTPEEIAKVQGHGLFRYYAALNLPVSYHLNMTQVGVVVIEPDLKLAETNPDLHQWLIDNEMTCGVQKANVEAEHRAYIKLHHGEKGTHHWYAAKAKLEADPMVPSPIILRFASDAHLLLFRLRWM